jgi:heat shock protein HslJ
MSKAILAAATALALAMTACAPSPETATPLPAPTGGAALAGGEWKIVEIGGAPVLPNVPVTIEFKDGRVFGAGSCNRFMGGYEAAGGFNINLGQMASTMMACPEPMMKQEQALLALLGDVKSYNVDANGHLVLTASDGRTVKARR